MTEQTDKETGEITKLVGFIPGIHGDTAARKALFAAMSQAQGGLENVVKDAKNPHLKSSYASLSAVMDTIRPVLTANGLALAQVTEDQKLVTMLTHRDGGSLITVMALLTGAKSDMQTLGSAITYARRYSTLALFGLAQEDDDGNATAGRSNGTPAGGTQAKAGAGQEQAQSQQQGQAEGKAETKGKSTVAGNFGKITDPESPVLAEGLKKVSTAPTMEMLVNIEAFAGTKYAGDALVKIQAAVAKRRMELAPASTTAGNPVNV